MKHTVAKLVWDCTKTDASGIPYAVPESKPSATGFITKLEVTWEPRDEHGARGHVQIRFRGKVPRNVVTALRTKIGLSMTDSNHEIRIDFPHVRGEHFIRTAAKLVLQIFDILNISYDHAPSAPSYTWVRKSTDDKDPWQELGARTWQNVLEERFP